MMASEEISKRFTNCKTGNFPYQALNSIIYGISALYLKRQIPLMKQALLAISFCVLSFSSFSQYYLRGNVKDEKGNLLPNVRINLTSKGTYPFNSGSSGYFGIPSNLSVDTIVLFFDGFEPFKKAVQTNQYQSLVMKMLPSTASLMKHKLSSITKNLLADKTSFFSAAGESYSSLIENDFIEANKYAETGFSLNVDRAAYSNARRFLNNELPVPTDAVRIEEMLNYFDFRSKNKSSTQNNFSCKTTITTCPWNNKNQLLYINLDAPKLDLDSIPPCNLVFLIDISGSMDKPNRLPLLQTAFKMLAENLREKDTVSIVTYGGGVQIPLQPTSGAEKEKINNIIDSLYADGDTPGAGAISTAYSLARSAFITNGTNRVILATDGDFNIGQTSEKELEELISAQKQTGIYLTCIGVGMGNYKDSKLETLAKKGNGNFAYLDNINEAEKVLVKEFTKTIFAVANDAYANVSFNSDVIKEYRLIGFDNLKDAISDSTSEIEGGEVGSGHSMMAVFEVVPAKEISNTASIAKLNLQYKLPTKDEVLWQKFDVPYHLQPFDSASATVRFATAVVMFGSLLKQSKFAKNYSFNDVLLIANNAANNSYVQKEFITLIQKADKIYNPPTKKNKKKKDENK
jgi:Ca-activated chloride channel family protein